MAALSIGLDFSFFLLMFARVHQQHVIQYRFVPEKIGIEKIKKKLHMISMDQQQRHRRPQQLCTSGCSKTKYSIRMAYDKCVCTMQVTEIQAPMFSWRSRTRFFNFSPRCTDLNSDARHFILFRIRLSEMMQLINNIILGKFLARLRSNTISAIEQRKNFSLIDFNECNSLPLNRFFFSPRNRLLSSRGGAPLIFHEFPCYAIEVGD